MGLQCRHSTQILAFLLLLLAVQLSANHSRRPLLERNAGSDGTSPGFFSDYPNDDYYNDDNGTEDDFETLLAPGKNFFSKSTPTNTNQEEETHASNISLKSGVIDCPQKQQGQDGQQSLFEEKNASSGSDSIETMGKIPMGGKMIGKLDKLRLKSAPSCKGSTFCVEAKDYPEELINQAMELDDTLKFVANVDVIYPNRFINYHPYRETSSFLPEYDVYTWQDVPLCVSREHVVYPKSAENWYAQSLFVVNHGKFRQGIRIETCVNEGGKCIGIGDLSLGYKTSCKQNYVYRQLNAVSTEGKIIVDMFKFASSCCCQVQFAGYRQRSGRRGAQRSKNVPSH